MSWKPLTYTIRGVAPLLMHNIQLADPSNYYAKLLKKLNGKRNKTDADLAEISRIEWYGGLHLHHNEPCITGEMIEGMLTNTAKVNAQAGLYCTDAFPLEYEGPRHPDALWADGRFLLKKAARVKGNRVMRSRPRFDAWHCTCTVMYNDEVLNARDVDEWLHKGGELVGLGDWVPKFGRFVVVEQGP